MASGKSVVGERLAHKLNYSFIDLDAEIVGVTGMSIPRIFETAGEGGFRELERHALEGTIAKEATVISLGGGALLTSGSLRLVTATGMLIYLRTSAEELARRLAGSRTRRPLLSGHEDDLVAFVGSKLKQRKSLYEAAHLTVDTDAKSVDKIVTEISRQFL